MAAFIVVAAIAFLLLLGAEYAHRNYRVPLDGMFLAAPLWLWRVLTIGLFLGSLGGEAIVWLRSDIIQPLGWTANAQQMRAHAKCKACNTVFALPGAVTYPATLTCPRCARQLRYADRGRETDYRFTISSGNFQCTHCWSKFDAPEPYERPWVLQCPHCGRTHALTARMPPIRAARTRILCGKCRLPFAVTLPEGQGETRLGCPRCGTTLRVAVKTQRPAFRTVPTQPKATAAPPKA